MYIVKDNNPDVGYLVSVGDVTDAEGNKVDAPSLTIDVVSDNDSVVSVTDDGTGKGTVSFGSPGTANLNATVKTADGTLLGSFGAQFTVTTGDPAAISGGTIAFEGLTEAAPAPTSAP